MPLCLVGLFQLETDVSKDGEWSNNSNFIISGSACILQREKQSGVCRQRPSAFSQQGLSGIQYYENDIWLTAHVLIMEKGGEKKRKTCSFVHQYISKITLSSSHRLAHIYSGWHKIYKYKKIFFKKTTCVINE